MAELGTLLSLISVVVYFVDMCVVNMGWAGTQAGFFLTSEIF